MPFVFLLVWMDVCLQLLAVFVRASRRKWSSLVKGSIKRAGWLYQPPLLSVQGGLRSEAGRTLMYEATVNSNVLVQSHNKPTDGAFIIHAVLRKAHASNISHQQPYPRSSFS
ncbi:Uncharacterized protein HZ326_16108 [Fusarium oxysporum f. sp. albedinis]|nr:Uncharacterized protein HZ326_16108 [Fusarium oxysporum f. sp. albedinis]